MIINYQYNEVQKTFDVSLPEKIYLRHNILTKEAIEASLSMEDYADDPNDMYEYSEFITTNYPLVAFWLCKRYEILEAEYFNSEYHEIVSQYFFEVKIENNEHIVTSIHRVPPPPPAEE
jgi:hypothetical protein